MTPHLLSYLLGRARGWWATHVVAPAGSEYDRIDQELERA